MAASHPRASDDTNRIIQCHHAKTNTAPGASPILRCHCTDQPTAHPPHDNGDRVLHNDDRRRQQQQQQQQQHSKLGISKLGRKQGGGGGGVFRADSSTCRQVGGRAGRQAGRRSPVAHSAILSPAQHAPSRLVSPRFTAPASGSPLARFPPPSLATKRDESSLCSKPT